MSSRSDKISGSAVGNLTPIEGNNLPIEHEVTISPNLLRLPNLYALLESTQSHSFDESPLGTISLQTLEMLEAELHNQAILPPINDNSSTLSQHVSHEINIWKWRARRRGLRAHDIFFQIEIGSYLVETALALLPYLDSRNFSDKRDSHSLITTQPDNAWRLNLSNPADVQAKLFYLEAFAGYILGRFEDTNDRYKKGLNLILRTIAVRTTEEFSSNNIVTLPISLVDFFEALQRAGH